MTPNSENDEIDLQELLRTLWRRKGVIFSIVILLTVLVTLVVFQIAPKYTASSNVIIDGRKNQVVDIESVMSGVSSEMGALLSEVEVIKSSSLIRRVVTDLNLQKDPEFNAELRPIPWYKTLLNPETYVSNDFLISIGLKKPEVLLSETEQAEERINRVINDVKEHMNVSIVGRSQVIAISFTSTNARKAALIANTIADQYIVDQLEAKFEATRRATSWLNDRLAALRDKVQTSEAAVQAYQESISKKVGQGSKMTEQQISELNSQLILAQASRAEAQARLNQVQRLLGNSADLSSAAEVLNSPLIQRLRDQEAELLRKVSELESKYGDRHPAMIKARAELADLRVSIEREVRKIAQSLKNEVGVAQARVSTLQQSLNGLERKNNTQNQAEIRLRELEREAKSNRLLYENFLNRFKETNSQEDLQQADARIISRAEVPVDPSAPKKQLIIAVAFVGSIFLGVVLVFVLEQLDNSFRSTEQLEQLAGVPGIGMIPLLTGNLLGKTDVGRFPTHKPGSATTESVRSLRTSLMLSNVDNPPRIVGITSTVPSEGKSTLAAWLAQVTSNSGQRTLLVDCDLRRPTVHKTFGADNTHSLVELLADECTIDQAIKKDDETGLYLLPAKTTQANALDLLSSSHMQKTLMALREHFDFIVLDAPPILAVSDSKVIGLMADKMLYVVKWDSTPRGLVKAGLKESAEAGIDLAGAVLTQVNVKKHAKYGYGDYGYYYGRYKDYYAKG
ncbi:polysaccharide biosynthesis tyrosine autokinase [Thalassospira profundimaris]|uniref:GumC family protein n=1 Tax=Thalassospira profundimaris TaxID=502049 RepID=UPI000DED77E8|nr:polysaccharide biosynthesis tyrosine autokinase [Thalassospira profundimaris]